MTTERCVIKDDFSASAVPGTLSGDHAACSPDDRSRYRRRVRDLDGVIGIDHGALRIGWSPNAGWQRASIAYGPVSAAPGVAALVRIEHALPTSKLDDEVWAGPGDVFPSLAVGFYGEDHPVRPDRSGAAFVFDAHDGANARLLAGGSVALERVQNVVFDLAIVRRRDDVAYLLASYEGVPGAVDFDALRLVALGPLPDGDDWWLGIHSRVLGEVDYQVDARVLAVRVAHVDLAFLEPLSRFDLTGRGQLVEPWSVTDGEVELGPRGAGAVRNEPVATVPVEHSASLVRAQVELAGPAARGAIELGPRGARALLRPGAATLEQRDAQDQWHRASHASTGTIGIGQTGVVELLADDHHRRLRINGNDVAAVLCPPAFGTEDSLAITYEGQGFRLRTLEVYPGVVARPASFVLDPPWDGAGTVEVFRDTFDGPLQPLDARAPWRHRMGAGRFISGNGRLAVDATRERSNPGRTVYAVDWDDPDFVDVAVVIQPPGTTRGTGHMGRGGICLWESPDDYVVVNFWLDDAFHGSSISMFVHANGSEPHWHHDATWSNAGARIQPGVAKELRIVSDGDHIVVRLAGEPVLWRRRTDIRQDADALHMTAVGLVANWEWGDDTGSVFRDFVLRGRA